MKRHSETLGEHANWKRGVQDDAIGLAMPLTHHARMRMFARRMSPAAVDAVVAFGRIARTRGAEIHAIGHREVREMARQGVDLQDLEGMHVVCSPEGVILTVYRNHDLRGLKPRRRSHLYRRRPVTMNADAPMVHTNAVSHADQTLQRHGS